MTNPGEDEARLTVVAERTFAGYTGGDGGDVVEGSAFGALASDLGVKMSSNDVDDIVRMIGPTLNCDQFSAWWVLCNETGGEGMAPLEAARALFSSSGGGGGTGDEEEDLEQRLRRVVRIAQRRMKSDVFIASWHGQMDLLKDFLRTDGALASAVDDSEFGDGYRPLHYAAYRGHTDACELLLREGAKIAAVTGARGGGGDNDDPPPSCTALFFAAQQGHADTVELLLRKGADARTICDKVNRLCALDVGDSYPEVMSLFRRVHRPTLAAPAPHTESWSEPLPPPTLSKVTDRSVVVEWQAYEPSCGLEGHQGNDRDALPVHTFKFHVFPAGGEDGGGGSRSQRVYRLENEEEKKGGDFYAEEGATDGGALSTYGVVDFPSADRGPVDGQADACLRQFRVTVGGLSPSTAYVARVASANGIGVGEYGAPSEPLTTVSLAHAKAAQDKVNEARNRRRAERKRQLEDTKRAEDMSDSKRVLRARKQREEERMRRKEQEMKAAEAEKKRQGDLDAADKARNERREADRRERQAKLEALETSNKEEAMRRRAQLEKKREREKAQKRAHDMEKAKRRRENMEEKAFQDKVEGIKGEMAERQRRDRLRSKRDQKKYNAIWDGKAQKKPEEEQVEDLNVDLSSGDEEAATSDEEWSDEDEWSSRTGSFAEPPDAPDGAAAGEKLVENRKQRR